MKRRGVDGGAGAVGDGRGGSAGGLPTWLSLDGADLLVRVKAVPGASRTNIAGPLGDRLKVRVAAPPEGGKANEAICEVLATATGAPARSASIRSGPARAEKIVRIQGAAGLASALVAAVNASVNA